MANDPWAVCRCCATGNAPACVVLLVSMGGVIVVAEATSWSAASWLVRWVFRTLVDDTDQPDLATKLRHPEETGFLYFSLSELPDTQRSEVVHLIRDKLMPRPHAENELAAILSAPDQPVSMDVPRVLTHLRSLVDLVGTIPS